MCGDSFETRTVGGWGCFYPKRSICPGTRLKCSDSRLFPALEVPMSEISVNDISRRRFLKESSVTAAAVGLGFLGRGALQGGIGPNDTVRVGVIGIGGRGGSHIQGFNELPGVEVAALCDVD